MVIHDRIAAGRHYVIEPSDLMQSRIYRVLQEWTNQPHARQPNHIIATAQFAALAARGPQSAAGRLKLDHPDLLNGFSPGNARISAKPIHTN